MKPLAVDLCCGLGGWTDGLLAEGWDVVGFDVEQHIYGEHRYPAQLVLQDILTLDGRQFRGKVSLIVASPPCQKYSYMAMSWTRAKALAVWYRDPEHPERIEELNALFNACHRIAREAECPIVVENVRGAQPWVGRARWMYGSFALWGDVPALMPMTERRTVMKAGVTHRGDGGSTNFRQGKYDSGVKVATMGAGWYPPGHPKHVPGLAFNTEAERATKNTGGSWFNVAHNTTTLANNARDALVAEGRKVGGEWFRGEKDHPMRQGNSKSTARKAASARIAMIPFPLASYIARIYRETTECAA